MGAARGGTLHWAPDGRMQRAEALDYADETANCVAAVEEGQSHGW